MLGQSSQVEDGVNNAEGRDLHLGSVSGGNLDYIDFISWSSSLTTDNGGSSIIGLAATGFGRVKEQSPGHSRWPVLP